MWMVSIVVMAAAMGVTVRGDETQRQVIKGIIYRPWSNLVSL